MWRRIVDSWKGEPEDHWEDDEDDSDALVTVNMTPSVESNALVTVNVTLPKKKRSAT